MALDPIKPHGAPVSCILQEAGRKLVKEIHEKLALGEGRVLEFELVERKVVSLKSRWTTI